MYDIKLYCQKLINVTNVEIISLLIISIIVKKLVKVGNP